MKIQNTVLRTVPGRDVSTGSTRASSDHRAPVDTYTPSAGTQVPSASLAMLKKMGVAATIVGVPALLGAASKAAFAAGGTAMATATVGISLLAGSAVLLSSPKKSFEGLLSVAPYALCAACVAPFLALPGQLGGMLGAAAFTALAGAYPLLEKGADKLFGTKGGAVD